MLVPDNYSGLSPIKSSLLEDEPDSFDLVEKFSKQLPLLITGLRNACELQDWETMKNQVFDLKFLGGSHGYPQVTEAAIRIESGLVERRYEELPDQFTELEALCVRIKRGFARN